jgi:WD40 repeat protein/serine/threonine protein kinase
MKTDSSGRNALLDQLADEFAARYRHGERPSLREYIDRYPDLADEIRELFPALVEIEQGKEDRREADEPTAVVPSELPEQIGDFRVLREIGRGGMGLVYEAEQVSLGRHVALKVLPGQGLRDPKHLQRFQREARAAAKLHHTNIVPVFGVGEQDGVHYYVMQFIQGQGLDAVLTELQRLRQAPPASAGQQPSAGRPAPAVSAVAVAQSLLTGQFVVGDQTTSGEHQYRDRSPEQGTESSPVPASASSVHLPGQAKGTSLSGAGRPYCQGVARIGIQVAEALAYANSQGILHRDIKPSNLLLDTRGTVWVTNFGLAKAADSADLTHTGDIVGTLRDLAPERFQGRADARSDVYALGLTLYELLTLRPAFDASDRNKLVAQVMHAEPLRPRQLCAEVPRDLETIVLKAMDRDPACRYQMAIELAADLQRFLENRPIQARSVTPAERLWRWCRRNPVVATLATLATLALIAVTLISICFAVAQADFAAQQTHTNQQLRVEQEKTKSERDRTEDNRQQAVNHLYHARVREAHSLRLAREVGYRKQVWQILQEALRLDTPEKDVDRLRQEAVACLGDFVGLEPTTWADFPAEITALAAHPDGEQLAIGLDDGTLVLRRLATGGPTARLEKHPAQVSAVTFGLDGKRMASASLNGTVKVWRGEPDGSWECTRTLDVAPPTVSSPAPLITLAFTDGAKQLAVCSRGTKEVTLWDLADGTQSGRLQGPRGEQLGGIALSPDGGLLAAAADSGNVLVWDHAQRELKYQAALPSLFGHPEYVAFSGDGRLLVCKCTHGIVDFDTADYQRTFALRTDGVIFSFSPAGALLAGADPLAGSVRLWNLASHRQEEMAVLRYSAAPFGVVFSGDSRKLAAAASRSVRVWNLAGSGEKVVTAGHDAGVRAVTFSPDGKLLAACSAWEQAVLVWDPTTGKLVKKLPLPELSLAIAFSSDGRLLAVASGVTVRFFDVASWQELAEHRVVPQSRGLYIAFSLDGKHFAAGGSNFGLTIWRLRYEPGNKSEGPRLVLESSDRVPEAQWVVALCFSPDGGKLAWVEMQDHKVRLWDVEKARPLPFPPANPAGIISSLTFHRDGLVLVSPAQEAEVWDVVAGRKAYTFGGGRLPPGGQDIRAKIALSADGRRFAWQGGGVSVWDMDSRKLLVELPEDDRKVWSLAWSPDGERLAVGLSDGTLAIWNLPQVQRHLTALGLGW